MKGRYSWKQLGILKDERYVGPPCPVWRTMITDPTTTHWTVAAFDTDGRLVGYPGLVSPHMSMSPAAQCWDIGGAEKAVKRFRRWATVKKLKLRLQAVRVAFKVKTTISVVSSDRKPKENKQCC